MSPDSDPHASQGGEGLQPALLGTPETRLLVTVGLAPSGERSLGCSALPGSVSFVGTGRVKLGEGRKLVTSCPVLSP